MQFWQIRSLLTYKINVGRVLLAIKITSYTLFKYLDSIKVTSTSIFHIKKSGQAEIPY